MSGAAHAGARAVNRVWTLARKDLLETRRDRLSAIFIIVMPIAFTAFFGLMFGSGSDRLPLALHDADGGAQATQLVARARGLRRGPRRAQERRRARAVDGRRAGRRRPAHPRGLLGGRPGRRAGRAHRRQRPGVVRRPGRRRRDPRGGRRPRRRQPRGDRRIGRRRGATGTRRPTPSSWTPHGAGHRHAGDGAARPSPSRPCAAGAAAGQIPSGFTLSSPGMMVNFIMFSLMTAGMAMIMERKNGTLRRLMTTRVRRSELIAGKMAGMFALTFVQQILLIGVGQLVLRRRLPERPRRAPADDGRALARRLQPRAAARRRCSRASRRSSPPS